MNSGFTPESPAPSTLPPTLELRAVSLSFDEKRVLTDVSFELSRGETLVLLGVTGAGKSVLLKLVLGLLKPDAGQILIDGQDLVPMREREIASLRRHMGIVFQEGALFDSLSVYENVAYRLYEEGVKDEDAIEKRVHEVLQFVEMEQTLDKMPAELSGGMRRRVAIARALISNPALMLYDSPTAGLDPVTAHTITSLIAKLRDTQDTTSIIVTHRLQDAYVLANFTYSPEKQALVPAGSDGDAAGRSAGARRTRLLFLREGKVYFLGTQGELASTGDDYLRKFLV